MRARSGLLIATAGFALAAAISIEAYWQRDPYYRLMPVVRRIILRGDMSWAARASGVLERVVASAPDKAKLAERMLEEDDANLVAYGMVLTAAVRHPNRLRAFQDHLSDTRGNWYLGDNASLATQLMRREQGDTCEAWVISLVQDIQRGI